jgi:hypothetical protein
MDKVIIIKEQTEEDREAFELFIAKGQLENAFALAFILGRLDAMKEELDSRKKL